MKENNPRKKERIIIYLIISFLILLNIGPLIGTEINKNITYNPDFYQHATGANQILQEKKISFENDNRLYWNSQTDLFYPPGFMIYLSVVSGLTNVPVLYLPIILTTIDWIIFIIMVYLITLKFFEQRVYGYIGIILALLFINGTITLGFSFLVPPVIGCFLLWTIIWIMMVPQIKLWKKILIYTTCILILFITHRPSILIYILTLIFFGIVYIFSKDINMKQEIRCLFISTMIAFDAAYWVVLYKIINGNNANSFFYNTQLAVLAPYANITVVILNIIFIGYIIIVNILNKHKSKYNSYIPPSSEKIKRLRFNISDNILLIIGFAITFVVVSIMLYPVIVYIIQNIKSFLPINALSIKNIWNYLFEGRGEFSYLRSLVYIFHIGILVTLCYIPGIILLRKHKNRIFTILPIFLIALTFLVYIVINTGDERPERTYLYIIPLFIVCTIAFIKHVIVNHNKPILYILLGLILISIIISSIVNIQNSKPFIDLKGDMALQWISDNNLSNQQIFASGYYSQVGRSQNINFLGLTYYNREVFNRFIVPNKLNNSFFLDDVYNKYADIKYLYGETQKIQNTLNVLYSNNNQMIIQKTTP